MTDETSPDATSAGDTTARRQAAETLLRLIDYAIVEGTALNMPTFVGLLRQSRLELMLSTGVLLPEFPPTAPSHRTGH